MVWQSRGQRAEGKGYWRGAVGIGVRFALLHLVWRLQQSGLGSVLIGIVDELGLGLVEIGVDEEIGSR